MLTITTKFPKSRHFVQLYIIFYDCEEANFAFLIKHTHFSNNHDHVANDHSTTILTHASQNKMFVEYFIKSLQQVEP